MTFFSIWIYFHEYQSQDSMGTGDATFTNTEILGSEATVESSPLHIASDQT